MIVRAITLGIEKDGLDELRALYAFDNSVAFAEQYALWDDWRFLYEFGGASREGKCADIVNRLMRRELFKRVFTEKPAAFSAEIRERLLELVKPDRDATEQERRGRARRRIEARIAELLGSATGQTMDPDLVLFHAFDIKSVKEMARNDEAGILVKKRPQPSPFDEESSLFRSINAGLNDEFVEVYAPVTWNHHADRDRWCDQLQPRIMDVIEMELAPAREGASS